MKRDDIRVQFLWYLLVGGGAFVVELTTFVVLMVMGLFWLPASITAFVLAQISNYFLSYLLAFQRGRFSRGGEITRLLTVSVIGLALNTAFVAVFVAVGFLPVAAKVMAVPLVLGWNFFGRRLFVFHKALPDVSYDATLLALERGRRWLQPSARSASSDEIADRPL